MGQLRLLTAALIAALSALGSGVLSTTAVAGNIDPEGDGSRHAWSENAGWIDAGATSGASPGVLVSDFELMGWMWSENAGWIGLSCKNGETCGGSPWGVHNDGSGRLSGHAWSENAGWIDFGPTGAGVTIDPATGVFAGSAWSENLGWISFGSAGPVPFRVVTAWRCWPTPAPPVGSPVLALAKEGGGIALSWNGPPAATAFDLVSGDLGALRATGSFASATTSCVANDSTFGSARDDLPPDPGSGTWYLVRGVDCGGPGTYDDGSSSQLGSRDPGIGGASERCP